MTIYDNMGGIQELDAGDISGFHDCILAAERPVVCRQFVPDWPLVQAARAGFSKLTAYLLAHGSWAKKTGAYESESASDGRIGYGASLREFNFTIQPMTIEEILKTMHESMLAPKDRYFYAGSIPVPVFFPSLLRENTIPIELPIPSINLWMGTKTRIAAHFDTSDNVACAIGGERRFTVFPPEEIENLYIGPLDKTPAGQSISLVDFHQPDLNRFPKFRKALESARTVKLGPGDAIYIPSMWWHHVECPGPIGVLLNYWWRSAPQGALAPGDALIAGFLGLRDLPSRERKAWRAIFDYYLFDEPRQETDHMTSDDMGVFETSIKGNTDQLKTYLMKSLQR